MKIDLFVLGIFSVETLEVLEILLIAVWILKGKIGLLSLKCPDREAEFYQELVGLFIFL